MPAPESSKPSRPEDDLLLLCARGELADTGHLHTAAGLVADWHHVERFAAWHGLSPLLYHHLSRACPETVPADVLSRLRDEFTLNSRRSLIQNGELLGILDTLTNRGIKAVPYKGPIASSQLYDNPAFRVAGDLDLLVRPEDATSARHALEAAGFRSVIPLSPKQDSAYRLHAIGYSLVSPHHSTIVDLQWELSPKRFTFRPPVERFRSRLVPVQVPGGSVETFCQRDTLMVLCLHGSKHVWESLKWLVDVAELVRRNPSLDYQALLTESEKAGCRRAVDLGLLLAKQLLDAPVPDSVARAAESDSGVRWMAERIRGRMFDVAPSREGKARIEMRLENGVLKQARYVYCRLVMPSPDEWSSTESSVIRRAARPLKLLRFLIGRTLRR